MAKKKEMSLFKRHDNPHHPGQHAHRRGLDAAMSQFEEFVAGHHSEQLVKIALAPTVFQTYQRIRRRS